MRAGVKSRWVQKSIASCVQKGWLYRILQLRDTIHVFTEGKMNDTQFKCCSTTNVFTQGMMIDIHVKCCSTTNVYLTCNGGLDGWYHRRMPRQHLAPFVVCLTCFGLQFLQLLELTERESPVQVRTKKERISPKRAHTAHKGHGGLGCR